VGETLRSGVASVIDGSVLDNIGVTGIVSSLNPVTGVVSAKAIRSPEEGVGFINKAVQSGEIIQRTSKTLARAGNVVTFNNRTFTLPKASGIARLADGSTVMVQVKNVLRDKSGLSASDRRIISNIRASRARGENPLVSNDLKRFV